MNEVIMENIYGLAGGAFAGYITNDIAISMLFKKYLNKFGGVVVETRNNFEDSVSQLVEDEIINHNTLNSQIIKDEFKNEVQKIINNFYNVDLYAKVEDKTIDDIKGISNSFNNLKEKYNDNYEPYINDFMKSIFSSVHLNEIFDDKNCKIISSNVFSFLSKTLNDERVFEELITELYQEHENKTLEDLITRKPIKLLETGFIKTSTGFSEKLSTVYNDKMNILFENLYSDLDVSSVTKEFSNELVEKKIINVLGEEKAKLLISLLKDEFLKFLKSSEGKETLTIISEAILRVLKNQNFTLKEILNNELEGKVEEFFHDKLPLILEKVIVWIRSIKRDFERSLEESVDEAIESYGSIKKNILKIVRNVFLSDIAKKYQLVDKIINYLESNKDDRKLSIMLSEKALEYLSKTNVSDVISDLESKGIFNSRILYRTLQYNLDNIVTNIPNELMMSIFDIKIGSILPNELNLNELLDKKIKIEIKSFIDNFIKNEKFEKDIKKAIKDEFNKTNSLRLNEIIDDLSSENIDNISSYIYSSINSHKENIINKIFLELKNNFNQKSFFEIIPSEITNDISQNLHNELYDVLDNKLSEMEYMTLKEFIDAINNIENIEEKTTKSFVNILDVNLEKILKGNIKTIVSKNISKLSNDELNTMMKEFMGKELKAINIAGAFLGGSVGIATNYIPISSSVPYVNLNSIPMYALIGVITNYIAIKMIFKPYKPIPLLKLQGVVPKNQPRFAENMAHFVDKKLLNRNVAQELFNNQKESVIEMIKNEVSSEDYKLILELIENNRDEIFDVCFETLKIKIDMEKEKISTKIEDSLEYFDMSDLNLDSLFEKISTLKNKLVDDIEDVLYQYIEDNIKSEKSINNIIPLEIQEAIFDNFKIKIDKLVEDKIIPSYDINLLKRFIKDAFNNKNNILEENLGSFVENKNYLKKNINNYISSISKKEDLKNDLAEILDQNFSKELSPNKRINKIFDGKFIELLENNIQFFTNQTVKELERILEREEDSIIYEATRRIKEEIGITEEGRGVLEKAKSFFKKATYEVFNTDEVVRRIVSKFIYSKAPDLIIKGQSDIEKIFIKLIKEFGESKVEDFSINLNRDSVIKFIEGTLEDNNTSKSLSIITDNILDKILSNNANFYLKKIKINKLQDILELFDEELNEALNLLKHRIESQESSISKNIYDFGRDILNKEILDKSLSFFTEELKTEDLKPIVQALYKNIFKSNSFNNISNNYIDTLKNEIKYLNTKDIIDISEMKKSVNRLLINEEFMTRFKKVLYNNIDLIDKIINDILSCFEVETKEDILDIILYSFVESLSKNFFKVIESLNISEVTENEINTMEAKKLESVFNQIAGTYFKKLIKYGFIGFSFGINNILAIVMGAGYILKNISQKKDTKELILEKENNF